MQLELSHLAGEAFCYLTTTGRISGRPHTIEIWFALHGQTLYMLSGGRERADWVKNAGQSPTVTVKIQEQLFTGQARLVKSRAEDALARQLIGEKYQPSEANLEGWLQSSLPVAVDLQP
ncbi:MAG TPA: nitroreductase/quinone reductase family protein [Ktedonobacteraceae bacterium]|nr:nitroreductase/quinone reductase family protein [Ktedonobacteraceae bacterium]